MNVIPYTSQLCKHIDTGLTERTITIMYILSFIAYFLKHNIFLSNYQL